MREEGEVGEGKRIEGMSDPCVNRYIPRVREGFDIVPTIEQNAVASVAWPLHLKSEGLLYVVIKCFGLYTFWP